jgi:hypothetical protein
MLDERMSVKDEPLPLGKAQLSLWTEAKGAKRLQAALEEIKQMCIDQNIIFDKNAKRLGPLLKQFGIIAESEGLENQLLQESSLTHERPKIGQIVPKKTINELVHALKDIQILYKSEKETLDQKLQENYRFFSIIDKNVRYSLYKSAKLIHYEKKGFIVEEDVDETDSVYIVLQGLVDYMMFKYETKMTVVAATYRSGEVFGDASIQK